MPLEKEPRVYLEFPADGGTAITRHYYNDTDAGINFQVLVITKLTDAEKAFVAGQGANVTQFLVGMGMPIDPDG